MWVCALKSQGPSNWSYRQLVVSGPMKMLGTKYSSPAKAAHAVTPEHLSSPKLQSSVCTNESLQRVHISAYHCLCDLGQLASPPVSCL